MFVVACKLYHRAKHYLDNNILTNKVFIMFLRGRGLGIKNYFISISDFEKRKVPDKVNRLKMYSQNIFRATLVTRIRAPNFSVDSKQTTKL